MRALKWSLLSTAFISVVAQAAPPTASLSYNWLSEQGSAGLSNVSQANTTNRTLSFDFNSGSLLSEVALRAGVDRLDPDWGRSLVTDRNGISNPLSINFTAPEDSLRLGLDFFIKDLSLHLDYAQNLDDNPFPGASAKASLVYLNYILGQRWEFFFSRLDRGLPVSYFINPDTFQTQQRPLRNIENREDLSFEQILAERWKARAEAIFADRPGDRPSFASLEGSLAWAFVDDQSFVFKTGDAHEFYGMNLYDDRGYFDASWAQIEYRVESSVAWNWQATLGTLLESETGRGSVPSLKVGTDYLQAKARILGKNWEFSPKVTAAFSSSGYQSIDFFGGFEWHI